MSFYALSRAGLTTLERVIADARPMIAKSEDRTRSFIGFLCFI